MSHVAGIVTVVAKEGKEDEVHSILTKMADAAITDEGCDLYTVVRPKKPGHAFIIVEVYRDRDALARHQANAELAALGPSLQAAAESLDVKLGGIGAGDRPAR